mmetsp:Transcript_6682/g.10160  ORF Transcript_6682/g.10160 Transcript_6682/m.10160 type:complete len:92 (-) Transcript_6682:270-545(-)
MNTDHSKVKFGFKKYTCLLQDVHACRFDLFYTLLDKNFGALHFPRLTGTESNEVRVIDTFIVKNCIRVERGDFNNTTHQPKNLLQDYVKEF